MPGGAGALASSRHDPLASPPWSEQRRRGPPNAREGEPQTDTIRDDDHENPAPAAPAFRADPTPTSRRDPEPRVAVSLLPLPDAHRLDPLAYLEQRARRLAQVVAAISRRRDVRERRAQLLLLVHALTCPWGTRPRRRWYEPGACVRIGAGGLHRAWRGYYGEDPPSIRTIRSHLGALERACVLVRAPGDWLPYWPDPAHPERRPRHADTFWLLETDAAAEWWAVTGRVRLGRHPKARRNPDTWRRLFAGWRAEASRFQLELDFDAPAAQDPADVKALLGSLFGAASRGVEEIGARGPGSSTLATRDPVVPDALVELAAGLRRQVPPLEVLGLLRAAGCRVRGRNYSRLAREPIKLLGAAAMFLVATRRGDRIRNRPGWVVTAFDRATGRELGGAFQRIARKGGERRHDPGTERGPDP